jgi:hypothetical protein
MECVDFFGLISRCDTVGKFANISGHFGVSHVGKNNWHLADRNRYGTEYPPVCKTASHNKEGFE